MGRGHFVSFDGEPEAHRPGRLSRMRQFEAVIVVWTEHSVQNAGLNDIARAVLPLNLLVPVRADDLETARIPLAFRKLNMFFPRDTDGISRLVARLSSAASSLREIAEREAVRRMAAANHNPPRGIDDTKKPLRKPAPAPPQQQHRSQQPPPQYSPSQHSHSPPTHSSATRGVLPPDRNASSSSRPAVAPKPVAYSWPVAKMASAAQRAPAARSARPREPEPVRGPVAAPSAVRVRPLMNLPEVDAGPEFAVPPPFATPPAPAASKPDRAPPQKVATADSSRRVEQSKFSRPHVLTAEDISRAVEAGLVHHHIPETMWLGRPTTVEVTLGREILARLTQLEGGGNKGQCLETLSVSLYGSSEAFEIERQSERTQFVTARTAQAARDPATIGRWAWLVTPFTVGPQPLVVRISALLRDRRGVPAPVAIPDRLFDVEIQFSDGEARGAGRAVWYRG
jgi:hypothetical protein